MHQLAESCFGEYLIEWSIWLMPKIVVLPHEEIAPEGAVLDASEGESVCDALLRLSLIHI